MLNSASRIECKCCHKFFLVKYFTQHFANCSLISSISRSTSLKKPLDKPVLIQFKSKIKASSKISKGGLHNGGNRYEFLPIPADQVITNPKAMWTKKLKSGDRYNESLIENARSKTRTTKLCNSQFGNSSSFMSTKTLQRLKTSRQPISKYIEDDPEQGLQEIKSDFMKNKELGVNEGFVSIPKDTLRSLPHFLRDRD